MDIIKRKRGREIGLYSITIEIETGIFVYAKTEDGKDLVTSNLDEIADKAVQMVKNGISADKIKVVEILDIVFDDSVFCEEE